MLSGEDVAFVHIQYDSFIY